LFIPFTVLLADTDVAPFPVYYLTPAYDHCNVVIRHAVPVNCRRECVLFEGLNTLDKSGPRVK
jgi:hypothetical protein